MKTFSKALADNLILASTGPCHEVKAAKLIVLRDNEVIKSLVKLYSTFISDSSMSSLPDFISDIDAVFVKHRLDIPQEKDSDDSMAPGSTEVAAVNRPPAETLASSLSAFLKQNNP